MAYSKLPTRTSADANAAADINQLTDNIEACMPIGALYIQFPNEGDPSVIGLIGTWTNVTSNYAGNFFRAEGGSATAFNSSGHTVQADQFQGHIAVTPDDGGSGGVTSLRIKSTSLGTSASGLERLSAYIRTDGINGTPRTGSETRPTNETIRIWKRTA